MKFRKMICLLCLIFILSACSPQFSDMIPKLKFPVCPGGPTIYGVDQEFMESSWIREHWEGFIGKGWLTPSEKSVLAECFLGKQTVVQSLYEGRIHWFEDGGEVSYAIREPLIGAPDLTKEERLRLERQIQSYAKKRGLKYSYLYSHGFVVFAFTTKEPELWVHEARKAYNERPEFGNHIEESEVRLQHQIIIEHIVLGMFDWQN